MKKVVSGLLTPALLVLAVAAGDLEKALQLKVVFVCIIGFFATIFQPAYSPIQNLKADKGTALQILWSVFLGQIMSLVEAFYFNYPESMNLDLVFVLGALLTVVGLFLRSWAYLVLGQSFTWFVGGSSAGQICEKGPYRILAHPSYTGALLTYVGIPLLFQSYWSMALSGFLLGVAFWRRMQLEEQHLQKEFGEKYEVFLKKRYRLVPFIY